MRLTQLDDSRIQRGPQVRAEVFPTLLLSVTFKHLDQETETMKAGVDYISYNKSVLKL